MISINSNINSFREKFKSYTNQFNNRISKALEYVTNEFYNQLKHNIDISLPTTHFDDYSFKYDIKIVKENDMLYKIKLGENSIRLTKDGNVVNPFYFFEFGFGYVGIGTNISGLKDIELGWTYDVNLHGESGWVYKIGEDEIWTAGIEGLGFLQDTISWYKNNKKDIITRALKKAGL